MDTRRRKQRKKLILGCHVTESRAPLRKAPLRRRGFFRRMRAVPSGHPGLKLKSFCISGPGENCAGGICVLLVGVIAAALLLDLSKRIFAATSSQLSRTLNASNYTNASHYRRLPSRSWAVAFNGDAFCMAARICSRWRNRLGDASVVTYRSKCRTYELKGRTTAFTLFLDRCDQLANSIRPAITCSIEVEWCSLTTLRRFLQGAGQSLRACKHLGGAIPLAGRLVPSSRQISSRRPFPDAPAFSRAVTSFPSL
ncbi:MAG: hypothetical protein FD148_319 [Methylocystaceae bacterium]|nr:MAG: hypothetical protein FD148_319 [Methylocystaceae bacterium]